MEIISLHADTLWLHPTPVLQEQEKARATKTTINKVLENFLAEQNLRSYSITTADSFFFLFNWDEFSRWHEIDWWQQRRVIRNLKTDSTYSDRAKLTLTHSIFNKYYDIPDNKVGYYDDPQVGFSWMRKRLLLQESYWNIIDSIAYEAYYHDTYTDMYPGIGVLICRKENATGHGEEMLLIADNGAGLDFKKTSKDSGAFRFIYKMWKLMHRRGLYLLGGLHLGLAETCGRLHCYGAGAVTTQCSYAEHKTSLSNNRTSG